MESPQDHSPLQGKLWLLLHIACPCICSHMVSEGANSDWRLINFALFGIVFLLSLVHWYDDGGWRRIKAPVLPSPFLFSGRYSLSLKRDLELTQWLQERVSSIIVDILLLMEHEARLEGTVIDVGVFGKIGVDQA